MVTGGMNDFHDVLSYFVVHLNGSYRLLAGDDFLGGHNFTDRLKRMLMLQHREHP